MIVKLRDGSFPALAASIQARDNGGSGANTLYRSEHLYLVSDTQCPGGGRAEDTPISRRCSPYITNVTHSPISYLSANIF